MRSKKKYNHRWIEIILMAIGGGCSVLLSQLYQPAGTMGIPQILSDEYLEAGWEVTEEGESEIEVLVSSSADGEMREQRQLAMEKLSRESSVNRLNMAFVFREGAFEPMDSVAGRVFSVLSRKDAEWMAEVYRLSREDPAVMAARAGKRLKQGETPKSWGKVRVSFYDGDRTPISGYSNAREILSMASVYAYFHDIQDEETFLNYAQALWNHSHSYRFSVSDFYYCDGSCLEQEASEDEEEIEGALYDEVVEVVGGDGERSLDGYGEPEAGEEGPGAEEASGESSGAVMGQPSGIPGGQGRQEGPGAGSTAGQETPDAGRESQKEESQQEVSSISEGEVAPENEELEKKPKPGLTILDGDMEGDMETGQESGQETEDSQEAAEETLKAAKETKRDFSELIQRYDIEDFDTLIATADPLEASKLYQIQEAYSEHRTTAKKSTASRTSEASESLQETETFQPGDSAAETDTQKEETKASGNAGRASGEKKGCQGHVDLTVSAYITGLKEAKNLFTKDTIGNRESEWTESWQGWGEECQAWVRELEGQDWYEIYGLTVSTSMYIRNPLSASEISYYMGLLPEGVSEERRQVIGCALESVGNIPYYWGGKPSKPGFEGNGFGTVVSPDIRGRALRGLDCSGWVNWVYWTALGERLPYASTSSFVSGGRKIDRSAMRPGDLIIKTGEDTSHVAMFLAWAEDGSMYLIHEVGNSTNNVTVGRYQLDWPYYRSFIDE